MCGEDLITPLRRAHKLHGVDGTQGYYTTTTAQTLLMTSCHKLATIAALLPPKGQLNLSSAEKTS